MNIPKTQANDSQTGGGSKRVAEQQNDREPAKTAKKQKLQKNDNPEDFCEILKTSEGTIAKFNTTATYYKISFNGLEVKELSAILKTLKRLFQSIIDNLTRDIASTDMVRMSLDNPELDFPIVLPFMRRSELTVERVLSEIKRVLQSYEQFVLDETLGIDFVHVALPTGSGHKRKGYIDVERFLADSKSVIRIRNSDDLCCARALVTAVARHEKHAMWNSIRQGLDIQRKLVLELHQKAGVPIKQCGIEEVKRFQTNMNQYQIHILSKEHFNAIIYEGPDGGVPIYLYLHDEHYDVITTMTGFLNRSYFCLKCKKGYSRKERHACNDPCIYCHRLHENKYEDWKYCVQCNRSFINETCFELHSRKTDSGTSTCAQYYRCTNCDQLINTSKHSREHDCGEHYCKTCKDFVQECHQCYMSPVEPEEESCENESTETRYIFFDFECTQDDRIECNDGYTPDERNKCIKCKKSWCGSFEHRPNLCVVQKVCDECMDTEIDFSSECEKCGPNERVFAGRNTTTDFCKWLFSEENIATTVICHNFKGYDSYQILRYLHDNAILPEVITTGSKYMTIKVPVCKMRFIDSLNFMPMALADMPKAFGETELVNGYFPHFFNTKDNQNAELQHLPDAKYYNPNGMKPTARQQFMAWHSLHRNDTFSFQEELLRYCRSDVDILWKCCLKFRQIFINLTAKEDNPGIDPFAKCITIASACNLVFRTNFLDHESIGIIPPHGYRPQEKQSIMAYQWLSFLAHSENIYIQHGRNEGERQIGPYKVDGYYETGNGEKIVLEVHGCFWHGCPKCYAKATVNPVSDMSMADLHAETMSKQIFLEEQGYTYICIWECEFKHKLETNPDMKEYIQSLEFVSPLEPRDAFYGGRTEGFKLYQETSESKQIHYYDVTSLYPFVNKTGKIPLGHPEIITENFRNIEHYEGLIKCKIVAPRGLYIPVLPVKCNGKLLFSLCRTCGENYQQTACKHSNEARAFVGTWVIDEVKMALTRGYEIDKIYEIWHFNAISQYDPITQTGGIFTEYVNTFLKVKQEASGWPTWCKSEDDRGCYIREYNDREGILLNYDNITTNPGLRSLAKLMLNSFWGKFGQRTNLTQTSFVSDSCEFFDMMTSDQQEIKNVRFVNDESVQIDWVNHDDFIEPSSKTNVVIAAYTTAIARLKLYSYLSQLEKRAMYCDTDSIVFTTRPGEWQPPLGDYLGDLTDEVPDNNITNFVTGGPKNYAYTLKTADKNGQSTCCKVRGITLNYKNSLEINYDTILKMVTGSRATDIVKVVDDHKICRNATIGSVITRTETKDYKIVFDKRVIADDFMTYPYGM